MNCDCVYPVMHRIRQRCCYLIRCARRMDFYGDPARAGILCARAFELSRKLLDLPVVPPESVDTFVDACLHSVEYRLDEDPASAVRVLRLTRERLSRLIHSPAFDRATRGTALDSYLLVCRVLAGPPYRQNQTAPRASDYPETVWRRYAGELISIH